MLILILCAILLFALAVGIFFFLLAAVITAAVAVGGWILATLVGVKVAGAWEKREEIMLVSLGVLLVAMVATLIIVW